MIRLPHIDSGFFDLRNPSFVVAPQIPRYRRRLIEKHGFSIIAVEADWPDAARIDRYVRHHAHEPSSEEAFSRFPTWMWRNIEVHDFVEWLRANNEHLPAEARTE